MSAAVPGSGPGRDLEEKPTPIKGLRPALAAGVTAGLVFLLSVVTAVGTWYRASVRTEMALAQGGEVVADGVSHAIASAEERLVATAGLYRASADVTRKEFARFVADVGLTDGMGALGFIARVPGAELNEFVNKVAPEFPGYQVFELDSEGQRVSVGPRPIYYPVQWFEPNGAFGRPHGFDSGSDPTRLLALERAFRTDSIIATPFLRLFSEQEGDGFIMYRRVVDPDSGVVEGFAVAPMDLSDLLAARIPDSIAETLTWEIVDVTEAPENRADAATGWRSRLAVSGRTWQVEVAPRDGSSLATSWELPLLVLAGGLMVSLSAATVAYLLFRRSETNRELQHLRELTHAKDRFLASVSHELRTPLTGVLGYAELLRDHDDSLTPEARQEMIRSVADQAFDLGHIIEDLLVAARAELNQLTVAKVPVSPQAQVAQVVEAYGPEIATRVKILDQLPPPLRLLGDPSRVRQIIRNLISNACRYGGPRIEVRIDEADQMIRMDVADNGPPIDADAAERIFQPYQRAHRAPGKPDSVGIGLSIARTLARLMGGDVTYSRADNWNVFQLSLPIASALREPVAAGQATGSKTANGSG